MGSLAVVVVDPGFEALAEGGPILEVVEVNALVFQRPPEALDEDIVHPAAFAIHGNPDTVLLQYTGEVQRGELGALIEYKGKSEKEAGSPASVRESLWQTKQGGISWRQRNSASELMIRL